MKILREVLIEDRLPNEVGIYHCKRITGDDVVLYFNPDKTHYITKFKHKVEYWYEEVDLELKSEEILPIEDRLQLVIKPEPNDINYLLNNIIYRYHKALEAAELEIAELKASKSAVRSTKKSLELKFKESTETIVKSYEAKFLEMENSKYDNYKKACANISWECIPSNIDKEQLKFNLKLAAGINDK